MTNILFDLLSNEVTTKILRLVQKMFKELDIYR